MKAPISQSDEIVGRKVVLERVARYVGPAIGLLIFLAALWVLHHTLQRYRYHEIAVAFEQIPRQYLLIAAVFTALNFLVLSGYDQLALRYLKKKLKLGQIIIASFVSYGFSQILGFGMLTGGSLRYRFYSAYGLPTLSIATIITFNAITFWIGVLSLGGIIFLVEPFTIPAELHVPMLSVRPIGVLFLLLSGAYLAWVLFGKGSIKIRGWEFAAPPISIALQQYLIAMVDWSLAGSVFYFLLPPGVVSYATVLAVFLLAQVIGLISHVPGGLGIFEALVLASLSPAIPTPQLLGTILAYRIIYYVLPLIAAAISLALFEVSLTHWGNRGAALVLKRVLPSIVPTVFSVTVFVGGIVLLISGATPALHGRMLWLRDTLPLPVIEISHFLGSLIGVALLFLAWGIRQRIDVAYPMTILLLSGGILMSLLKGADYEEAIVLAAMLLAFLPCRRYFYRPSALSSEPLSWGWRIAIVVAVTASIWTGYFSYKHVEYSHDLWWRFTFHGDASRFLRASFGVVIFTAIIAFQRLLRPVIHLSPRPTPQEIQLASSIVQTSPETTAQLAYLGDKRFLFSSDSSAFIMYGVYGRSWVALGDPVGPRTQWRELIWRFREISDHFGGWTVFYQVKHDTLYLYLDLGLTAQKIGEEAMISLDEFCFDRLKKTLRHSYRKVAGEGATFEIVSLAESPEIFADMERISDLWLRAKNTREKGFSLGNFNADYLQHFPIAVVRQGGQLVAFANLLSGADHRELSVDLMRHIEPAPTGLMDYLFISLMLWGKQEKFGRFNFGMAPFSGLENRTLAPIWSKLGAYLFQHGEQFYNFQGLRAYKDKFNPVWEPRYLVCPGGLVLPRVMTNIAGLVSRGLKGAITK